MNDQGTPWTNLTHVGLVVHDLDKAVSLYETLGAGPFKRFRLPGQNFEVKFRQHFGVRADDHVQEVAWGSMGPIAVEIFQCIHGDSIPQRFLDTRGEGIWHYGYDVEDMNYTIAWMAARGYTIIGEAEYVDGTRMCYFDTDRPGGVYFQAHEIAQGSHLKQNLQPDTPK